MNNPKKELLFVMNNLHCGGAEKALTSLLSSFDYTKYNVDLLLFKQEGLFLNQVPKEVTILPEPEGYHYFDMSLKKAIIQNLRKGRFKLIFNRLCAGLVLKTEKNKSVAEQKMWKYLGSSLKPLDKKYDAAIGFLEKTPNYFCVDKVTAKVKIGFVMNDYNKLGMNKSIDNYYFSKLNFIAQDSNESREVMVRNFPQFESKFVVVKSIIASDTIAKMAEETISDFPNGFSIISIGRLTYQKGYDLALDAIKILADKKINFNWVILGDGEDKQQLVAKIAEYNLTDKVFFLGIKANHYPYLKKADIFLHTARFEGFGIVVHEAKILNKPMVLTDFNIAKTHITDTENGLISQMNPEAIAESLEKLISDENLRNRFSQNLAAHDFGTEKEIESFYKLLNNCY